MMYVTKVISYFCIWRWSVMFNIASTMECFWCKFAIET